MAFDPTEERPPHDSREPSAPPATDTRRRKYNPPPRSPAPPLTDDSDRRFARDYYRRMGRWPELGYKPDDADTEWAAAELATIEVAKQIAAADQADPMSPYHQGSPPPVRPESAFANPAARDASALDTPTGTVYDRPDTQPTQVPTQQQEEVKMPETLPSETATAQRPPAQVSPASSERLAVPKTLPQSGPRPVGIQAARKRRGKMRIALVGPSGSGKTFSALLMARGMIEGLGLTVERRGAGYDWWVYTAAQGGEPAGPARILVADTEAGSACDYEGLVPFDVAEIEPPYTIQRYRAAYDQAVAGGYDVLIYDSGTHLWAGEGGLLAEKDAMTRGGSRNGYEDWAKLAPKWEAFKSGIITQTKVHLIVTFRTKTEYDVDPTTKKRVKIGLKAIARDEIEYEFTSVLEINHAHQAENDKDRTGLYAGQAAFQITALTGKDLIQWRMSGADEAAVPATSSAVPKTAQPAPEPAAAAQQVTNGAAKGSPRDTGEPPPTPEMYLEAAKLCLPLKTTLYKEREKRGWNNRQITRTELQAIVDDLKARAKGGAS